MSPHSRQLDAAGGLARRIIWPVTANGEIEPPSSAELIARSQALAACVASKYEKPLGGGAIASPWPVVPSNMARVNRVGDITRLAASREISASALAYLRREAAP